MRWDICCLDDEVSNNGMTFWTKEKWDWSKDFRFLKRREGKGNQLHM